MIHLLNSAPVGIMALDSKGGITFLNAKAETLLDLKIDQARGKQLAEMVQDQVFLKIVGEGAPDEVTSHNYHGQLIIVRSAPLHEPSGSVGRVVLLQDSSALRKQCEEAEQLRDEVSSLLENSYDGIILADADTIRTLLQAIRDRDWWVRERAADALVKIGGPKVVQAMTDLIRDEDEFIRRTAVEVLAGGGHEVDLVTYHEGDDVRIEGVSIHRIRRPPLCRRRAAPTRGPRARPSTGSTPCRSS